MSTHIHTLSTAAVPNVSQPKLSGEPDEPPSRTSMTQLTASVTPSYSACRAQKAVSLLHDCSARTLIQPSLNHFLLFAAQKFDWFDATSQPQPPTHPTTHTHPVAVLSSACDPKQSAEPSTDVLEVREDFN